MMDDLFYYYVDSITASNFFQNAPLTFQGVTNCFNGFNRCLITKCCGRSCWIDDLLTIRALAALRHVTTIYWEWNILLGQVCYTVGMVLSHFLLWFCMDHKQNESWGSSHPGNNHCIQQPMERQAASPRNSRTDDSVQFPVEKKGYWTWEESTGCPMSMQGWMSMSIWCCISRAHTCPSVCRSASSLWDSRSTPKPRLDMRRYTVADRYDPSAPGGEQISEMSLRFMVLTAAMIEARTHVCCSGAVSVCLYSNFCVSSKMDRKWPPCMQKGQSVWCDI